MRLAAERQAVAYERVADALERIQDGEWIDALLNIGEAAERLAQETDPDGAPAADRSGAD